MTKNPEAKIYSINALAEMTGVDRRTIKRRLQSTPPRETQGTVKLYALADLEDALSEPQGNARFARGGNPFRRISECTVEILMGGLFGDLPKFWPDICKGVPKEQADTILSALFFTMALRVERYLKDDVFDREFSRAGCGFTQMLSTFGFRALDEPTQSFPLRIPDAIREIAAKRGIELPEKFSGDCIE